MVPVHITTLIPDVHLILPGKTSILKQLAQVQAVTIPPTTTTRIMIVAMKCSKTMRGTEDLGVGMPIGFAIEVKALIANPTLDPPGPQLDAVTHTLIVSPRRRKDDSFHTPSEC